MLKASYSAYNLQFKSPVLTSRGGMKRKEGYFLSISDGHKTGIGECSYIKGLSADDLDTYEEVLSKACSSIEKGGTLPNLDSFPSIVFGLECARLDFENGGKRILFDTDFVRGKQQIPINGLVWMGTTAAMREQVEQKVHQGYRCIKIKVGALDFEDEVRLLHSVRQRFPADVIELRLDANGAFKEDDVFQKLDRLSKFAIHSIEQPIKARQYDLMAEVCSSSPIPIALDEELIGVAASERANLLTSLKPQYIVLKPSLAGGLEACDHWIALAEKQNIDWWATSALESNIGLNAIAQWVSTKGTSKIHGLGTGALYTNNIPSPLYIQGETIGYDPTKGWGDLNTISC